MNKLDWKACRTYLALLKRSRDYASDIAQEACVTERKIIEVAEPLVKEKVLGWDDSNEAMALCYFVEGDDLQTLQTNRRKIFDKVAPFLAPLSPEDRTQYNILRGIIVLGKFTLSDLVQEVQTDNATALAELNKIRKTLGKVKGEELLAEESGLYKMANKSPYTFYRARRDIIDAMTPFFADPDQLIVPRSFEFSRASKIITIAKEEGRESANLGGFYTAKEYLEESLRNEGGDNAPKPILNRIRIQMAHLERVKRQFQKRRGW